MPTREALKSFESFPDSVVPPKRVGTEDFEKYPDYSPDFDPKKQAVTKEERALIKNLISGSQEDQKSFLESKGYEVRQKGAQLQARLKSEPTTKFGLVEPEGELSFQDVTDVLADIVEGVATGLGAVGGTVVAGPAGGIIGGAAAAGATEAGKQVLGRDLGVIKEVSPIGVAKATGAGALGEVLGPLAGRGVSALGRAVRKLGPAPRETAGAVTQAAEVLGVKPVPSQVLESRTLEVTEDLLAKEPGTLGGIGLRKQIEFNENKLKQEAEALLEHASDYNPEAAGAIAKEQIKGGLQKRLEPIERVYQEIEESFGDVPADVGPLRAAIAGLRDELKFGKSGIALLDNWEAQLADVRTVADLKKFRTNALRAELPAQPTTNQRRAISRMYDEATNARRESFLTFAEEIKRDPSNIDKALVDDIAKLPDTIAQLDREYAKVVSSTKDSLFGVGASKRGSPKELVGKFDESIEDVQVGGKVFRVDKPRQLRELKENFPEAFETLRQDKLAEIFQKSKGTGTGVGSRKDEISVRRFVNNLRSKTMPKTSKDILFGEEAASKIDAMITFLDSNPPLVNPSGTSNASALRNVMNHFSSIRRSAWAGIVRSPERMSSLMQTLGKISTSRVGRAGAGQAIQEGLDTIDTDKPFITPPQRIGR